MERDELRKKAEEYLAEEENDFFRGEMEGLLAEENYAELEDRLYTGLTFGTGGLRGVIGAGTNRMNAAMVRRATQGLANYINKAVTGGSAVIAYDSRRFSETFALEAALVLAGNGIKVSLFSSLRPTPELSFAVRRLEATAGIVVTASHNPPEYNGYKVYWSDGGQIVPPHDIGIIEEVGAVESVKTAVKAAALKDGMLTFIDEEIDGPFVEMVKSNSLRPDLVRRKGGEVKVVYTPLHGTGAMLVERTLGEMGITVTTVPEQREPDGDFPTVDFPNPEEASAMKMAVDLGKKLGADLVMGTDPDADRFGIAVPDGEEFALVTGNQLGSLLADYIFSSLKDAGKMPAKPVLVKTIVTSELQRLVAESYGATCYDVLTGFKYIAEKIKEFETTGETYVFGGEESYGFLVGTEVRDKDAIGAAAMAAELALWNRERGKSVLDHLTELWERHGYFEEILMSKTFKGKSGKETMASLMASMRDAPPAALGGLMVGRVRDVQSGIVTDGAGTEIGRLDLPSSNVLQFVLDDGSLVTARPSGTEPKIKFYASCRGEAGHPVDEAREAVKGKLGAIRRDIEGLIATAE